MNILYFLFMQTLVFTNEYACCLNPSFDFFCTLKLVQSCIQAKII